MVVLGDTHDNASFRALIRPRNANRMSRDILPDQALNVRNGNMQAAAILPADHPHAKIFEERFLWPPNLPHETDIPRALMISLL